jgi:hypothetical protein
LDFCAAAFVGAAFAGAAFFGVAFALAFDVLAFALPSWASAIPDPSVKAVGAAARTAASGARSLQELDPVDHPILTLVAGIPSFPPTLLIES